MSIGDYYLCGTCRNVWAPAPVVNGELQVVRALRDAQELRWRLFRLGEHTVERVERRAALAALSGHGPRRDALRLSELKEANNQLLAEPDWRDADTSVLREVAALADDWTTTSHTRMRRQWPLIAAAAGDHQLTLTPKSKGTPRVHVRSRSVRGR